MGNIFDSIKVFAPRTNRFDLSHDFKFSCNMGELVPILVQECLPGDRFNLGAESLIRFSPLVAPVMHRFDATIHYFFVPNRIIWPNWEPFITQDNGDAEIPAHPYFNIDSGNWTKFLGYMGIPEPLNSGQSAAEKVSALPFAAFAMIYNEYYRDQNLIEPIPFKLIDGDNTFRMGNYDQMRYRAWEHDYFTASLPFAQKGPAVDIPLGTADVVLKEDWHAEALPNDWPKFVDDTLSDPTAGGVSQAVNSSGAQGIYTDIDINNELAYDPKGSLEADIQPTTINDLRVAYRLQEWLEKQARGGTRYFEQLYAHFFEKSPDARLQRPEYITGNRTPVHISEVLNTTGTDEAPQGAMAGHGVSVVQGKKGYYKCKEHGWIIGVMSIRPKPAYMQGIPRHFLKTTDAFDYAWPTFAHLGEQPVQLRELYAYTSNAATTFGYVPRYAEYKYNASRVAGQFATTLDFWHEARDFDGEPELTQEFIECKPSKRIFAVTDEEVDSLLVHVYHRISALRKLPKFGTPLM